MDIEKLKKLYEKEMWSLRMIASEFQTNHHLIKRILLREGIQISSKGRKKFPPTAEQKKLRGERRKARHASGELVIWSKGKKMTQDFLLKNMIAHLRWEVKLEWLRKFEDIERLKFLNKVVSRYRLHFDTCTYVAFVERFYHDSQFISLYSRWNASNKDKWLIPSIDHINPKASGGDFNLDNLRFITWFENRAKADMSLAEWEKIKANITEYFV